MTTSNVMVAEDGFTFKLFPVEKIAQGLTRMAARELIHKRLRIGVRFVIRRRDGRWKQFEEWTITAVSDIRLEATRHIKERVDGKDSPLATVVGTMSLSHLSELLAKGLAKIVFYNVPVKANLLTEKEEKALAAKAEKKPTAPKGEWRPMRTVSRAERRRKAGLPRRVHVKKHEFYDPHFGRHNPKSK